MLVRATLILIALFVGGWIVFDGSYSHLGRYALEDINEQYSKSNAKSSQYLALPKSSLFGRTSPAEPSVILIRNL
jgi:hypothetical protein